MATIFLLLVSGAGLWAIGLQSMDMRKVTDLGLISVTPAPVVAGIALITLGFVLTLRLRRLPWQLLAAATLLLLLAVHALPSIVEDAPRQSIAYLHAGFTDEIERTGNLLTNFDARFSWPVFFILGALVTNTGGIQNAVELQTWAAPVLNILYLVPLYSIYTSLSADRRLVWTALFIFVATNWIGQDYYSPQGFNFLLYLTVLAILFRWFGSRRIIRPIAWALERIDRRWPNLRVSVTAEDGRMPDADSALSQPQRAALAGVLGMLMAVSVASHQLTPFAMLASLTVLTVLRRISLIGLPVLLAVMIGMWISYMTVPFLQGHLADLVTEVGAIGGSTSQNVTQRLTGSDEHQLVVQARLVMTGVLWLCAMAGAIRRFRHGHLDVEAITLAAVPFGLMPLQAYGGEMLLRVYLFSLPFAAFLTAGLFFPVAERIFSPAATRTLAAAVAVFAIAILLTKHGNERADWVSADELAAADYLYATAPAGSTLGTVSGASPIRYRNLEQYNYINLTYVYLFDTPKAVEDYLRQTDGCAYIFVSRMQQATAEVKGLPPGYWDDARARMISSRRFSVVYENRDATILEAEPRSDQCQEQAPV